MKNGSLQIATADDIPAIMAIERMPGFDAVVGRSTHDQHAEMMAAPSTRYLVLRDGAGGLLGFTLLQRLGESDARVHLKRIAVRDPGARIGSSLLKAAIDWLFTETATNRLDLDVYVDNERARRAYEKAGFTVEGRLREYHLDPDGSGHDVWIMSVLRREWQERRG